MRRLPAHLLRWYDENRRDLPWRVKAGAQAVPYHVWLSEIMLQQTTVATVIPYFQDFITRWPTVRDLARADDDDVMACWAGLGYYARARNLLKTARIIAKDYAGVFPQTAKNLRALPGIGEYTCHAILAIAFDKPVVAYDVNVTRVLARVFGDATPPPRLQKKLRAHEEVWDLRTRAGDFTQALMDFGAMICRAKAPHCHICPIASHCMGREMAGALPVALPKPERPHFYGMAVVFTNDANAVLLDRRPENGMLGGMAGFLGSHWRYEKQAALPSPGSLFAQADESCHPCGIITHGFTHFTLSVDVYKTRLACGINWLPENSMWVADLDEKTLPSIMRKIWRKTLS
ncbi:MAG: A/G-specific adenine glycosylase [Pseudomonadota bacterium]